MKTAYPNTQTTCKIRLYSNIPFDNTYKHHCLISNMFTYNGVKISGTTSEIKERFLDRKYQQNPPLGPLVYLYPHYDLSGDFNFDFSNGINGSVTLELTPAQTNANYLRLTCGSDVYYYFITAIKQENFDTYTLTLELDVIMTYQDEFLDGMKDMPVMTKRKHCHLTYNGAYHSEDYKTLDGVFSNATPTIIKDKKQFHFENANMKVTEGVVWAYICCDATKLSDDLKTSVSYRNNNTTYPLIMLCVPLNITHNVIQIGSALPIDYGYDDTQTLIQRLINSGYVKGCKLSYYPPFTLCGASGSASSYVKFYEASGEKYLFIESWQRIGTTHYYKSKSDDGNEFVIFDSSQVNRNDKQDWLIDLMDMGAFIISNQKDTRYIYDAIQLNELSDRNGLLSNILDNRGSDPKLMFYPFREYTLMGYYDSKGYTIHTENRFSNFLFSTENYGCSFSFSTYVNGYIGDNNIYTYLGKQMDVNSNYADDYLQYMRVGLASNFNYIVPCGEDALDVFKATQENSYRTSKVASGITSGLQIVGGVASIIGGGVALSSGVGAPMAFGMFSAGGAMIAGGVSGLGSTIASSVAKYNDLENTPDSINISGSSFIMDSSIEGSSPIGLPYILVKDCDVTTLEKANDFFYEYGYEVVRCCYFNTELKWTPQGNNNTINSDTNLFTRTIFNFIQVQDDMVNKINADIPLVVKKRFNEIFNAGITLWSFFGFKQFYDANSNLATYGSYDVDKWFLKTKLNNSSYVGDTFPA